MSRRESAPRPEAEPAWASSISEFVRRCAYAIACDGPCACRRRGAGTGYRLHSRQARRRWSARTVVAVHGGTPRDLIQVVTCSARRAAWPTARAPVELWLAPGYTRAREMLEQWGVGYSVRLSTPAARDSSSATHVGPSKPSSQ